MSRLLPRPALALAVGLVALGGTLAPANAASTGSSSQDTPDSAPISIVALAEDPSLDIPQPADRLDGDIGSTSAVIRWNPPQNPIAGYRITSPAGERDQPSTVTRLNLSGLRTATNYEVRVRSVLPDGERLSDPLVITFKTLPRPAPVPFDYSVTGSAELPTLVRGSLPLKGTAKLTYAPSGGESLAIAGTLTLGQASVRLIVSGSLPVTAKIAFVSSGPATGGYGGVIGSMWLEQKVRIKVLEAKLFGAIPLAGGNSCQTKQLTTLTLNAWPYSRANGGLATGKFAISALNDCGSLGGLVSPTIAGSDNTISFRLAAV